MFASEPGILLHKLPLWPGFYSFVSENYFAVYDVPDSSKVQIKLTLFSKLSQQYSANMSCSCSGGLATFPF